MDELDERRKKASSAIDAGKRATLRASLEELQSDVFRLAESVGRLQAAIEAIDPREEPQSSSTSRE